MIISRYMWLRSLLIRIMVLTKKINIVILCTAMFLSTLGFLSQGHTALAGHQTSELQLDGRWVVLLRLARMATAYEASYTPSLTISGNSITTVEYSSNLWATCHRPNDWGGFYFGINDNRAVYHTQHCLVEPAREQRGSTMMTYRRTTNGTFSIISNEQIEVTTANGETHTHRFLFRIDREYGDVIVIGNVSFKRDTTSTPPTIIYGEFGVGTEHGTIINTASELASIGGSHGIYILANDIEVSGNWTPIENFRGTLDGAGFTVTFSSNINLGLASAGLFQSFNYSTVIIRNLGLRTLNAVTATAPNSNFSVAYAGGLVGIINGGSVTIENVFFDGNVRANAFWDTVTSGLNNILSSTWRSIGLNTLETTLRHLEISTWASFVSDFSTVLSIAGIIADAAQEDNGSRAFAGGLVGQIGRNANVRIINSYARGSVRASARALAGGSALVGAVRSRAHSGGLVGFVRDGAQVSIENTYVTNNIEAHGAFPLLGRPDAKAGALVGGGRVSSVGENFRSGSQSLYTNRGSFPHFHRGEENTTGISRTLSHAEMQNQASFRGWDFDNVWALDSNRNGGFPHHVDFVHIAFEPITPPIIVPDGFTGIIGSGSLLTFEIDMPLSTFEGMYVNGVQLQRDVHYTLSSGSTVISLLSSFIDTLEDGFHTLTVHFAGEVSVDEQFLVEETGKLEDLYVSRFYIDDTLVFSADDGGLLISEHALKSLYHRLDSYSIEFSDGHIMQYVDGVMTIGMGRNTGSANWINGGLFAILIVAAVLVCLTFARARKVKLQRASVSTAAVSQVSANGTERISYCGGCGVKLTRVVNFCGKCGRSS